MGVAASAPDQERVATKIIFINVQGKYEIVQFPVDSTSDELKELFFSASGLSSKWTAIVLRNSEGHIVPITSSLPENTPETRYQLETVKERTCDSNSKIGELNAEVLSNIVSMLKDEIMGSRSEDYDGHYSERWSSSPNGSRNIDPDLYRQYMGKRIVDQSTDQTSPSILDFPRNILTHETIEQLKSPEFDVWLWDTNEMLCLTEYMFLVLGIAEEFKIDTHVFRSWLLAVEEAYHENPFHNFRHAFTVTQMMYSMINLCELSEYFSMTEIAVLMTAAICHDIDHPGFSNSYQINAHTELAILYNDISPLENHHCAVTFEILVKPQTNIFKCCSKDQFKEIRAGIIELILATDMSKHGEMLKTFKQLNETGFDCNNVEHRKLIKKLLLKCCDVSNEVRPMEVSEPWVDCLLEEYFIQSDKEKQEGLPVAPFMDRDKVTKPASQIGFIHNVLIPIFEQMAQVFPQIERPILCSLQSSLSYYQNLKLIEDTKSRKECNRHDIGKMV